MNKKGFTLVEILAVIVLISLLFGIGIPSISKISKNMKVRSYNQKIKLIEKAAILWGQENKSLLQKSKCVIKSTEYNCYKISIAGLINDDYLDSETKNTITYANPIDDKSMVNMCVYIYKKDNRVYSHFKGKASDDEECLPYIVEEGGYIPVDNTEYNIEFYINSIYDIPCSFDDTLTVYNELIRDKSDSEAQKILKKYSGEKTCKEKLISKLQSELVIKDNISATNLSYDLLDYNILGPYKDSTNSYFKIKFVIEVEGKYISDEMEWPIVDNSSPILLNMDNDIDNRVIAENASFSTSYLVGSFEEPKYYTFDNYDGFKEINISFVEDLVSQSFGEISYNYLSKPLLVDTIGNSKEYNIHYNVIDIALIEFSNMNDYYYLDSSSDDPVLKDFVEIMKCNDQNNYGEKLCKNHAEKIQISWGDSAERSGYQCTWTKGAGYTGDCLINSGIAPEYYPYNDAYNMPVSIRIYTDSSNYLSFVKGVVLERRYSAYTDRTENYLEPDSGDESLYKCDSDMYNGDCRPKHCYNEETNSYDPC